MNASAFLNTNKHKLIILRGIGFFPQMGKLLWLLGDEIKNDFHGCCFPFRNFLNLESFRETNNENDKISHQHHALWFSKCIIIFVLYHWGKQWWEHDLHLVNGIGRDQVGLIFRFIDFQLDVLSIIDLKVHPVSNGPGWTSIFTLSAH